MGASQRTFIVVILSAILAVAGSEIYAPSVPHLVREFNASLHFVQWSMAIYMIGICATQLVYGPLSDRLGRRKPMIFGMILFTVGAILGATAQTMEALLIARFIQGVGAGGPTGLWRSTFRDVYHGPELAQNASYVTLAISAVLPISPALGGYLESTFGWQGSFVFMSAYGLFAFLFLLFGFKETNKSLNPDRLPSNLGGLRR
jgi:multidrug resistance protein